MRTKSLKAYLPKKVKEKRSLIQAHINTDLVNRAKKIMQKEGFQWRDIITAALENLVDSETRK